MPLYVAFPYGLGFLQHGSWILKGSVPRVSVLRLKRDLQGSLWPGPGSHGAPQGQPRLRVGDDRAGHECLEVQFTGAIGWRLTLTVLLQPPMIPFPPCIRRLSQPPKPHSTVISLSKLGPDINGAPWGQSLCWSSLSAAPRVQSLHLKTCELETSYLLIHTQNTMVRQEQDNCTGRCPLKRGSTETHNCQWVLEIVLSPVLCPTSDSLWL